MANMICSQKYMAYMLEKEYRKEEGVAWNCHINAQWPDEEHKTFEYMSFDEWLEKNDLNKDK